MRTSTKHIAICTICLVGLFMAACGGEEGQIQDPTQPAPTWVNKKPLIAVASPGEIAIGEPVTVLGQHFVEPANGNVVIRFKGTFFDDQGGADPVDYQAKPTVLNSGKLKWEMFPNIVFSRTGDRLGKFVGSLVVLNYGKDGSQLYSDPLPLTLEMKPSIIPRVMRPISAGCSSMVQHTLEKQAMGFVAEVVGLRPGTKDAPLTFYWTFMASQWKVGFNYGTLDPSSIAPKTGAFMLEDQVTSGKASSVSDGGSRNFLLKVGSDLLGSTSLKELKTGEIPKAGNNMPVTVNVAVVDATGKTAKLAMKLTIHRQADMHYDGTTRIAVRFGRVLVSDCIPGQDIGRDLNYHEATSESRSRSLNFNWNAGIGGNVAPIPSNPFMLGINFNVGFGVNVSQQVSSDKSKSLSISGHILPGEYGAFYRQTTKVHRVGKITMYTVCGQAINMGDVVLTDWMFTPDLATGATCPPKTLLQPAQKFNY
jgi:hypothetical protein